MSRPLRYPRHMTVRVDAQEQRQLQQHAQAAGLSVSRYLVMVGLQLASVLSPEERAQRQRAIFHARKIGVNLNQLAHRLHSDDRVSADELRRALEASTDALAQLVGNRHG